MQFKNLLLTMYQKMATLYADHLPFTPDTAFVCPKAPLHLTQEWTTIELADSSSVSRCSMPLQLKASENKQ